MTPEQTDIYVRMRLALVRHPEVRLSVREDEQGFTIETEGYGREERSRITWRELALIGMERTLRVVELVVRMTWDDHRNGDVDWLRRFRFDAYMEFAPRPTQLARVAMI